MRIHVPRSRLGERVLLDAFHMELDATGRVALPASFRVTQHGPLAAGALEPEPSDPTTEAARTTGPNKVCAETRTVSGVANVEQISRSGIRLSIAGLDVEHFNQCNPVVLACHEAVSANLMPGAIGTIERVSKAQEHTVLRFRNLRFDTDPLAEAWFQKVLSGTVRMVSVGFLPIEWSVESETTGKGKDKKEVAYIAIPESELLEISVVPIGANRGALFGQHAPLRLLERMAAVEQRAAALQEAVAAFLQAENTTAARMARSQLIAASQQFTSS